MVEFFTWRFKDCISDYLSEHNSVLVMENTKDASFHDEMVYNVSRLRLVNTLVEFQYSKLTLSPTTRPTFFKQTVLTVSG